MPAGEHHAHGVMAFSDLRHGILVNQLRLLRNLHGLVGQGPRCWQQSSALASQTSAPSLGWVPTHRQEVGGLQADGLVPGGRDDGRLGLGCRGGSDDLGPGQDLKLEGFRAQWAASLRPPSLPSVWGSPNLGLGLQPPEPHTTLLPPRRTFGTGNCVSMAGLGFAASLAVAVSGGKRKRSLGQKKAGLGRDSGRHL